MDGTGVRRDAQNNQKDSFGSESSLSFLQLLEHMLDFNRRSFSIVLNLSSMGEKRKGSGVSIIASWDWREYVSGVLSTIIVRFLGAFAKLQKVTVSFVMSVRPSAWNYSASIRRIFMKFDIWVLFENLYKKIQI